MSTTTDPRGPLRTISAVEWTPTAYVVAFEECGHTAHLNATMAVKVGERAHCLTCRDTDTPTYEQAMADHQRQAQAMLEELPPVSGEGSGSGPAAPPPPPPEGSMSAAERTVYAGAWRYDNGSANWPDRFACCNLHLGRAVRAVMAGSPSAHVLVRIERADSDTRGQCECGRAATYFVAAAQRLTAEDVEPAPADLEGPAGTLPAYAHEHVEDSWALRAPAPARGGRPMTGRRVARCPGCGHPVAMPGAVCSECSRSNR